MLEHGINYLQIDALVPQCEFKVPGDAVIDGDTAREEHLRLRVNSLVDSTGDPRRTFELSNL
jgi:hypothetical protein